MPSEPVVLNVYDLSTYNSWLYNCGFGGEMLVLCSWAALQAHSCEAAVVQASSTLASRSMAWSTPLAVRIRLSPAVQDLGALLSQLCAGHDYDMSGIFATNPRDAPEPGVHSLQLAAVRKATCRGEAASLQLS